MGIVDKFCVGAYRRVRLHVSIRYYVTGYGCIPFGCTWYPLPASTKAPFRTLLTQPWAVIGRWCFRPPADTALRLMGWLTFGLYVAFRDGFRVGADRCALPHREAEQIMVFAWSACRSFFQKPFVGAGLCACPLGRCCHLNCHRTTVEWLLLTNPPLRDEPLCPPARIDSLLRYGLWMHPIWLRAVSASSLHQGAL